MTSERLSALRDEHAVYEMLASVFLELPTLETVERLLSFSGEGAAPETSAAVLAQFAAESRERDREEVLLDIARERVVVVRGGIGGIRPPYESLYAQTGQNEMMGSLNRFYAECGFAKADEVKDASDQIGVEYAFLATLVVREIAALEAGEAAHADELDAAVESFRSQHLSRWAPTYARSLLEAATTSYWRAIALAILEAEELRS